MAEKYRSVLITRCQIRYKRVFAHNLLLGGYQKRFCKKETDTGRAKLLEVSPQSEGEKNGDGEGSKGKTSRDRIVGRE